MSLQDAARDRLFVWLMVHLAEMHGQGWPVEDAIAAARTQATRLVGEVVDQVATELRTALEAAP
jgi:hypothetical protein